MPPVCFLPESLRGIRITDLTLPSLEWCTETESLHDETFDAASTSHNFLTRGKYAVFIPAIFFFLKNNIIICATSVPDVKNFSIYHFYKKIEKNAILSFYFAITHKTLTIPTS